MPAPADHKFLQLARQRRFWLAFIMSLAGYWLARFWFPLRPYYNQIPLSDIRAFSPSLALGMAYAAWLVLLYGLYWLAYREIRRMRRPPPLAVILLTAVFLALPLLQTYPINANDIYRYVIRGRISSVYGQNPFAIPPAAITGDPFLPLAGEWAGATSPYGPVWELIAAVVTAASQDNLFLGLNLFKLLGLAGHLAITALIWLLLAGQPTAERSGRTLLWAWNPALLLMFVVDAHNDVLMLFWLLLGWWLAGNKRPTTGSVVMMLAPLTKPIGLLFLPFFFVAIWRKLPAQARRRFLLGSVLGGITAVSLAFLPFGSPLSLLARLQNEAAAGASFSVSALLLLLARFWGVALAPIHVTGVALFSTLALASFIIWLLWRTWRGRSPLRAAADSGAAYILTALNFRIWYTTWLFPWLLLNKDEQPLPSRLHAGLWLLLTAQLSVLIYGHLRVYVLGSDPFLAHLIGVPFTFGLPLLLANRRMRLAH